MAKKHPSHLQPVDSSDVDQEPEMEVDPSHPFLPGVEPESEDGDGKPRRRYDPKEFIWPASDDKGQSRKIWCRLPPMVEHQMEVIVASKKFPYTFTSDLVRHAIIRHLGWLLRMESGITSYIQQIDAMGQVLGHVEQQQRFSELADRVDRVIGDLVGEGTDGRKEALKLLHSLLQQLNGMEDGYWKDRTKDRILRKHGGLLDMTVEDAGDVSLTDDGEGE